jgi:hypothetical protein
MENTALIITHLVPETDSEKLKTSAKVFKTINLTASFDEHCACRLVDEDETPEIVRPGFAALFVSFTIWDSSQAADTFQEKLKLLSEINIEDYVFARWKVRNGELPVLYEAFGKIWFSQNLDLSPTAESALFPELLKSFGRNWLMDTLGPTEDPFIYDRWEIRKPLVRTDNLENPATQEAKNAPDNKVSEISLPKDPFGQNDNKNQDG